MTGPFARDFAQSIAVSVALGACTFAVSAASVPTGRALTVVFPALDFAG